MIEVLALVLSSTPDVVGWDWKGIITHLGIGQAAAGIMAVILLYGRYHMHNAKSSVFHWFAHSYRAQFVVNFLLDLTIAILTIQVLGL